MDQIRAFYAGMEGKFPGEFTPPLLREELEEETSEALSDVG